MSDTVQQHERIPVDAVVAIKLANLLSAIEEAKARFALACDIALSSVGSHDERKVLGIDPSLKAPALIVAALPAPAKPDIAPVAPADEQQKQAVPDAGRV